MVGRARDASHGVAEPEGADSEEAPERRGSCPSAPLLPAREMRIAGQSTRGRSEVEVGRIPELLGEIERLREPPTSAAAESSVRRTSARFVDSSRPEGPRPEGPCPGEPP